MLTLCDPLLHAERSYPDRDAVIDGSRRLRFADFIERIRRVAGAVAALTEPGDRVALLATNSSETLELHLGVPAAGRAVVPLNTRLSDAEIEYILDDAQPRLLVTDRPQDAVTGLARNVDRVIELGAPYEAWLSAADAMDLERSPATPDSLAGLFYTGGTTGRSKGVMLSHANRIADTFHLGMCLGVSSDDSWIVLGPMYHASGTFQSLLCVWQGAPQILLPAFEPGLVLDLVEQERATIAFGVPLMLRELAEHQAERPRAASSLRLMGYGAAPASSSLLARFCEVFPDTELVSMYGATELAPMGTCLRHMERDIHGPQVRSAGRPVPGVRMRVVGEGGETLPPGGVGEVVVRGPNVMQGYWNKPDATAAALRDGWYHTGDLGSFDEEGRLFLVDRKKDMIISGGENVYSTEVEDVLSSHPDVLECAVFGVPDDKWGEAVYAVVVPRPGGALDSAALLALCREQLAGYKLPKQVDVREEPLPRTAAGKILKRDLREPFWQGESRRIHG